MQDDVSTPELGLPRFCSLSYVALAVLARNIPRIGAILWQRDELSQRRSAKHSERERPHRLAA